MIPLALAASSDAEAPFVTRLAGSGGNDTGDSRCIASSAEDSLWSGPHGLLRIEHSREALSGDVVLVRPAEGRLDRLLRSGSRHNSLLVTEQCDQLCVMCSQPPKKTHDDRFDLLRDACLLADAGMTIGITGGEPTLHRERLLAMIEDVLAARPDLSFHVLTNAQHFRREDVFRLRRPEYAKVVWGIPLYSADPLTHDRIVGKSGAYERLIDGFAHLMLAGARIELRTVLTRTTVDGIVDLADMVVRDLAHVEQWSLMGLENIGFARNRWSELHVDLRDGFVPVGHALDVATLRGVPARLFNVPLCHVPQPFRHAAVASISDWKQRFGEACSPCRARSACSGFFEWHPPALLEEVTPL